MPNEVEPVAEPTAAEVTATAETPEASTASATEVSTTLLDSDAFVNKVADAVFDRMKSFTGSLIQASETAQQIAAEMLPPVDAGGPAPDENMVEEAPPPDQGPQRRHKLFSQPGKRNG